MGRLRKIPMSGRVPGRRRISAPVSILAVAVVVAATVAVTGTFTGVSAAGSGASGPALRAFVLPR